MPNLKNLQEVYMTVFLICFGAKNNNKTGNKTRLVKVAVNSVTEVSQPSAMVPPKLLPQKIINPAINTNAVYTILKPVFFIVALTVSKTL